MRANNEISKSIDGLLLFLYILLCLAGIVSIFAATYNEGEDIVDSFISFRTDYGKQTIFFLFSLFAGIVILLTDSKFFTATANLWYTAGIFLLLLVFPFHSNIKGTESIIKFGNAFQLQPIQLCIVFANLALAKYMSRIETDFSKLRSQLIAASIVVAPALLAILQKETGLALVYFSFFLVMFREGLPAVVLIIGFSFAILVVATLLMNPNILALILTGIALLAAYFMRRQIKRHKSVLFWIIAIWAICVSIQRFAVPFIFDHVLQPYQVKRIYDTIGKDYIPKDAAALADIVKNTAQKKDAGNYNVKQSKIAIGSGGLLGKGLLKGTQTRYAFVPEQRTDFIFCTIGEGFGFVGSMIFLAMYVVLLFRIVTIAERQRSTFSRCYAYGVASVLFFHIAINLCMTMGLAPVIGIPLPFVSYGGLSLVTFSIMIFILLRLDKDRQMVLR
ncbi:rod shape-determining protein RodA [Agriterribacter sp.]|uniref:rod shape-determining protein RodA n=1 Tax=Agriterribacter sp. TaxID=2821509 RepID=UPI002CBE439E|nr:rod shape-determining protein RodA [Agriterribacter sp.]HRP54517.1 rod shape-determining protein RodA [Agriterribacter sp.]